MQRIDFENTAQLIAENVDSTFEQKRDGTGLHPYAPQGTVAAITGNLLAVMPTTSSAI